MDLIQSAATVALLSLLAYFVIVNILERIKGKSAVPSTGHVTNYIDVAESNSTGGLNLDLGVHSRTTVGEPVAPGGENVTQLSVYNEMATGVLPVNHDPFEKQADFGSDVTNINQFYKNNPEIFERSMTTAPDAAGWFQDSQQMFNLMAQQPQNTEINAWNFEKDPLANTSGSTLN